MKKPDNESIVVFCFAIFGGILMLLLIALVALSIYVAVKYGGKPVGEIPFWALWFLR